MFVSISYYKLEKKESGALVANLFGDYEKAAGLYAATARKYWDAGEYQGVLRTVTNACKNLRSAGMHEEVVEGIVTVSNMLLRERRPLEAIGLSDYYAQLEQQDPTTFRGGARFSEHIRRQCKEKLLIRLF